MRRFSNTILLLLVFGGFFLLIPSRTSASITRPQCCYATGSACSLKPSSASTCQPVTVTECVGEGLETPACYDTVVNTSLVQCDLEPNCRLEVFSDSGVFWQYEESKNIRYGLPAEIVLTVTPQSSYEIRDISCVNCRDGYTSVSIENVVQGGTRMTIIFDTKKYYDDFYTGQGLHATFSVIAEVYALDSASTTYSLRQPQVIYTGITDQLSLCKSFTPAECAQASGICFAFNNSCYSVKDQSICSTLPQDYCGTTLGSPACTWSAEKKACQDTLTTQYAKEYTIPDGYDGPLPACAFDGSCRDINDLLAVAIKIGELALGFVGSLALVFFVYGGFTMILSMGNAEKVKKGREILVAAVIGIVIAFSAYAIVNFTLDVLQVQNDQFRVIK